MRFHFPSLLGALVMAPSLLAGQTPTPAVPLGPDERAPILGVYAVQAGPGSGVLPLRVFERGDTLMGRIGDNAPTRLLYQGDHVFRPEAAPEFTLAFSIRDGRAEAVTIRSPEGSMTGVRSSEAALDASRSGALFDELAAMDSLLFDASYVQCDPSRVHALLAEDVEFYHDLTGFHAGDQVRQDFEQLAAACPGAKGVTRRLVPGSLRVYPIQGFGAVQMGAHTFGDAGASAVTEAQFVHLWHRTEGGWKVSRILSFEHRNAPR